MATVAGVKVKAKPRKIRNPLLGDEKYTGVEPQWPVESEKWPDEQFDSFLRRCFYYYNYYYTQKDCKKYVTEWMRNQKQFTPEQVRQFERAGEKWLPMTACSLVMAHRQGMQLPHQAFRRLQVGQGLVQGLGVVVFEQDHRETSLSG